jgi:hypothetical protein
MRHLHGRVYSLLRALIPGTVRGTYPTPYKERSFFSGRATEGEQVGCILCTIYYTSVLVRGTHPTGGEPTVSVRDDIGLSLLLILVTTELQLEKRRSLPTVEMTPRWADTPRIYGQCRCHPERM